MQEVYAVSLSKLRSSASLKKKPMKPLQPVPMSLCLITLQARRSRKLQRISRKDGPRRE